MQGHICRCIAVSCITQMILCILICVPAEKTTTETCSSKHMLQVHRVLLKLHLWSLVVPFEKWSRGENTMMYYCVILECIVMGNMLEKNAHGGKREQR